MPQEESDAAAAATHKLFWEESESLVAKLTRGYLSNLVLEGRLTRQAIVLSDKRLYFFGVRWTNYGGVTRDAGMQVLPLEHISSVAEDHEYIRFMDILRILGLIIVSPVLFAITAMGAGILQESDGISRAINNWLSRNGVTTVENIGGFLGAAVLIMGCVLTFLCLGRIVSLVLHILFGRRHNFTLATQSAAVFIDYRFHGRSAITKFQKHLGVALTRHRRRIESKQPLEPVAPPCQ
jgi:hypothetical protein